MTSDNHQCSTLFSINMLPNRSCMQQLAVIPACWPEIFKFILPLQCLSQSMLLTWDCTLHLHVTTQCLQSRSALAILQSLHQCLRCYVLLRLCVSTCMLPHSTMDAQQGTACDGSIITWRPFPNIWNHMTWDGSWDYQCSSAQAHAQIAFMSPYTCKAHQSTGKILGTKLKDTAGMFNMQQVNHTSANCDYKQALLSSPAQDCGDVGRGRRLTEIKQVMS